MSILGRLYYRDSSTSRTRVDPSRSELITGVRKPSSSYSLLQPGPGELGPDDDIHLDPMGLCGLEQQAVVDSLVA